MVNFSGTWRMRGELPGQVMVTIEHSEPRLVQRLVRTAADGTEQSLEFTYLTTGEETHQPYAGGTVRVRAAWRGEELVIESWAEVRGRNLHLRDHWSLSADGVTLTMAHPDDDLAGQISVFEKVG